MKVLLITGGTSSERRISLMSAKKVSGALKEAGHQIKLFDLKKGFPLLRREVLSFDVVFPVIHGEEGEGGKLQKFLSDLKVPFVGGDPTGFKEGWYKIPFKKFCEKNNISTAPWKIVKTKNDIIKFGFPSVLKGSCGGSSREVVILKSEKDLSLYLCRKLLKSNLALFVERYLPGVEVTVGVLKNKALPVIEIVPPKGGWFDYQNKYWGETQELVNSPSLTQNQQKKIKKIALKIHKSLNLGHYSRIDFIHTKEKLFVLEVNTIPGLTASSLFPKAAAAVGISFPKLMEKLVLYATESSF